MKVIGNVPCDFGEDAEYFDGTIIMLTEYEYEQLQGLIKACKSDAKVFEYIGGIASVGYMINHIKKVIKEFEAREDENKVFNDKKADMGW
jgi:hypothetical protein